MISYATLSDYKAMPVTGNAAYGDESRVAGLDRYRRPRIIVVDDDPTIGCALAGVLNHGGCDVEVFHSAVEALAAFDRLEIDLAVVDWIMPGLDGLDFIDMLKTKAPNLPALLITSYDDHEKVKEARTSGKVAAVLAKPFDLRIFISAVQSCLNANQALAANEWSRARETENTGDEDGTELLRPTGQNSYFEEILNSITDAVLMVDRQGRIVYNNQAADRMFGLSEKRSGQPNIAGCCPEDSQIPESLICYFKPHPPVEEQNEAFFRGIDGEKFYAIYSVSWFKCDGAPKLVVLVIKNIHDRYLIAQQTTKKNQDLEVMAVTDPLTGIYNRRYFDRRLAEELKRVERYNSPLTLIMIDFDHFKLVNDVFGHLVGDKVLATAAKILTKGLRDVDTLARWGGEEFMILLPETNAETGAAVARRLHSLINESRAWSMLAAGLKITVSMGMVNLPWSAERASAAKILGYLDRALYQAKDSGRNRIIRHIPHLNSFERI